MHKQAIAEYAGCKVEDIVDCYLGFRVRNRYFGCVGLTEAPQIAILCAVANPDKIAYDVLVDALGVGTNSKMSAAVSELKKIYDWREGALTNLFHLILTIPSVCRRFGEKVVPIYGIEYLIAMEHGWCVKVDGYYIFGSQPHWRDASMHSKNQGE